MEEGRRTADIAKRKEIYRKGLEMLYRDIPILFVGHYPNAQASRAHLKNMETNARGDISWGQGGTSYAWLEK